MIVTVFGLTLRQILGRQAALLALAVGAISIAVALVYRFSAHADPEQWTAKVLLDGLFITTLVPLCALFFGTAVLGSEIEDGTDVFLLTNPIDRWKIIVAKWAAACLGGWLCLLPATIVAGVLSLSGRPGESLVGGFAVAILAAIGAYSALFLWLSILTSRALIAGLIYVFLWEGLLSGLFSGIKFFSIRQYALGIAELVSRSDPHTFQADLDGLAAVALLTAVSLGIVLMAVRRLEIFQIRDEG
jgi:ABC-2 type transport system permease protein